MSCPERPTEAELETYRRASVACYGVIAASLCVLGVLGNTVNLAVLCRPRFRSGAVYLYLTALAVSDLMTLAAALPYVAFRLMPVTAGCHGLVVVSGAFLATYTAHCFLPLSNSFVYSSMYVTFWITVDRFLAVRQPARYAATSDREGQARRRVLVSVVMAFLVNMPAVMLFKAVPDDGGYRMVFGPALRRNRWLVGLVVLQQLMLLTPAAAVLVMNVMIMTRVRRLKRAPRVVVVPPEDGTAPLSLPLPLSTTSTSLSPPSPGSSGSRGRQETEDRPERPEEQESEQRPEQSGKQREEPQPGDGEHQEKRRGEEPDPVDRIQQHPAQDVMDDADERPHPQTSPRPPSAPSLQQGTERRQQRPPPRSGGGRLDAPERRLVSLLAAISVSCCVCCLCAAAASLIQLTIGAQADDTLFLVLTAVSNDLQFANCLLDVLFYYMFSLEMRGAFCEVMVCAAGRLRAALGLGGRAGRLECSGSGPRRGGGSSVTTVSARATVPGLASELDLETLSAGKLQSLTVPARRERLLRGDGTGGVRPLEPRRPAADSPTSHPIPSSLSSSSDEPVSPLSDDPVPSLSDDPVPSLSDDPVPSLSDQPVPSLSDQPVSSSSSSALVR